VRPTRPTTITGVQFTPNTGEFVVTNLSQITRTWQPGESGVVELEFRPTAQGLRTAQLVFVADNSKCDTVPMLIGFTPGGTQVPADSIGAGVNNIDFGAVLGCHDTTASVTVRNTGNVGVRVSGIAVTMGAPNFSVTPLGAPVTIPVGGSTTFPVTFSPSAPTTYDGEVSFTITMEGSDSTFTRVSSVRGSGATLAASVSIPTDLRALAGDELVVPISLATSIAAAKVDELTFEIRYNRGTMIAQTGNTARMTAGTTLSGWSATVVSHEADATDKEEMVLTVRATAPAGGFATGTGTVLNVPFRTVIGDVMRSSIPFTVSSQASPCVQFNATQGEVALDSICGLSFRLVEASNESYALRQNAPNPFNPTTTIEFGVGLDARTTLVVYDAQGRRVATLVDAYLQPGRYSVVWDASTFPSGLYYYRLVSNMFSQTNAMILQK
jgi:hypothetical protein